MEPAIKLIFDGKKQLWKNIQKLKKEHFGHKFDKLFPNLSKNVQ
jgi:hypothetical protein